MCNQCTYNVECMEESVGAGQDLPYNETEIVLKKKAVRYAVPAGVTPVG